MTSIKNRLATKASTVNADDIDIPASTTPYQARTAPGQLMGLQGRVIALEKELEQARANSQAQTIPLDQLHEVEGRRRRLTEQQFSELVENLRNNELITPITVRPREEGGFEIVSGNNRVAAYRKIGRAEIDAVVRTLAEDRVIIGAFYANLLQPQLPDYEKYLGFAALLELEPGLTLEQMAEQSGLSVSAIHRLMAFGSLPQAAMEIIDKNPGCIGAAAAAEMAALAKDGKGDRVIKAIERLATTDISQEEAVRLAATPAKQNESAPTPKPQPIAIKAGKAKYLTIRPTGVPTSFKLEFADENEATETMAAFQEWIKSRLATKTPTG